MKKHMKSISFAHRVKNIATQACTPSVESQYVQKRLVSQKHANNTFMDHQAEIKTIGSKNNT